MMCEEVLLNPELKFFKMIAATFFIILKNSLV